MDLVCEPCYPIGQHELTVPAQPAHEYVHRLNRLSDLALLRVAVVDRRPPGWDRRAFKQFFLLNPCSATTAGEGLKVNGPSPPFRVPAGGRSSLEAI